MARHCVFPAHGRPVYRGLPLNITCHITSGNAMVAGHYTPKLWLGAPPRCNALLPYTKLEYECAIMFLLFARSYLHVWNLLAQAILGTWSGFQLEIRSWVGNICPAPREISWCIWRAPYILWIMPSEQRRHLITTKGLLHPHQDLVGFLYYSWGACYNSFELHVELLHTTSDDQLF